MKPYDTSGPREPSDDSILQALLYTSLPDPSASHLEETRRRLLAKTKQVDRIELDSAGSASPRFASSKLATNRHWRHTIQLSMSIAGVLIAIVAIHPLIGNANAGLSSSLYITRMANWIHAITSVEYQGNTIHSESWCAPQLRIAAFRNDHTQHFVDYAAGYQVSHASNSNQIFRWAADQEAEHWGLGFVSALLSDSDVSGSFPLHHVSAVDKSTEISAGKTYKKYTFQLELKFDSNVLSTTEVLVEPTSQRLVSWVERFADGKTMTTKFDYPAAGPQSIYELGVSADATIKDRLNSADVSRLAKRHAADIDRFGNYDAIVIDRVAGSSKGTPESVMFRRIQRQGLTRTVDWLKPLDESIPLPSQLDADWWQESRHRFETIRMVESDGVVMRFFPTDFPQVELVQEVEPTVRRFAEMPVVTASGEYGALKIPPWQMLWPEFACRPIVGMPMPTMTFDFDPEGTGGPPGTVRLSLLVPDGSLQGEFGSYWLSTSEDHCVLKSSAKFPDFAPHSMRPTLRTITSKFSDFKKSPAGVRYATRRVTRDTSDGVTRETRYILTFQ